MLQQIDILLPTFNGEKFIYEQVFSILNQTYKNFNLIIRDDGSDDNTVNIIHDISKKDNRIIVIKDKLGNVGLVKSIEILLLHSNANLIMFADQDDIWFNNKIDLFYNKCIELNEGPFLIYSDCYLFNEKIIDYKLHLNKRIHKPGLNRCLFNFFVQGASSMIDKKLKELILPFPKSTYVHDRYIHLIAEITGKIAYISEPTMYYRQHSNNLIGASKFQLKSFKQLFSKKRFFVNLDKILIMDLFENRFNDNFYLKIYEQIVNDKYNRLKKLYILLKNKIILRKIDLFRLLFIN